MWRSRLLAAAMALAVGAAAFGGGPPYLRLPLRFLDASADPIPQGAASGLVLSRCMICHTLEVATQQRQGPQGWAEIIDRMISYGAPIQADERAAMIHYLVQHFGDPAGR